MPLQKHSNSTNANAPSSIFMMIGGAVRTLFIYVVVALMIIVMWGRQLIRFVSASVASFIDDSILRYNAIVGLDPRAAVKSDPTLTNKTEVAAATNDGNSSKSSNLKPSTMRKPSPVATAKSTVSGATSSDTTLSQQVAPASVSHDWSTNVLDHATSKPVDQRQSSSDRKSSMRSSITKVESAPNKSNIISNKSNSIVSGQSDRFVTRRESSDSMEVSDGDDRDRASNRATALANDTLTSPTAAIDQTSTSGATVPVKSTPSDNDTTASTTATVNSTTADSITDNTSATSVATATTSSLSKPSSGLPLPSPPSSPVYVAPARVSSAPSLNRRATMASNSDRDADSSTDLGARRSSIAITGGAMFLPSMLSSSSSDVSEDEEDEQRELALKNLPWELRFEDIQTTLMALSQPPVKIRFLRDQRNRFSGVVFVKYASAKSAAQALKELNGLCVGDREVTVEVSKYRKKKGKRSKWSTTEPNIGASSSSDVPVAPSSPVLAVPLSPTINSTRQASANGATVRVSSAMHISPQPRVSVATNVAATTAATTAKPSTTPPTSTSSNLSRLPTVSGAGILYSKFPSMTSQSRAGSMAPTATVSVSSDDEWGNQLVWTAFPTNKVQTAFNLSASKYQSPPASHSTSGMSMSDDEFERVLSMPISTSVPLSTTTTTITTTPNNATTAPSSSSSASSLSSSTLVIEPYRQPKTPDENSRGFDVNYRVSRRMFFSFH